MKKPLNMTNRAAFEQFHLQERDMLVTFKSYQHLKDFRISTKPILSRPLFKLADLIEESREKKLEQRFNLPVNYLSGVFHVAMKYQTGKRLAYQVAQEYYHSWTEQQVQATINRLLPKAIDRLMTTRQDTRSDSLEPIYCSMRARTESVNSYQSSSPGHNETEEVSHLFKETVEVHPHS